jgi:hypothetical protein
VISLERGGVLSCGTGGASSVLSSRGGVALIQGLYLPFLSFAR